ncbi:hypothetical protein [Hydrogenivirga sp. 128-5-R1-1]|uniref:hypothetical protein n=1 Tax=Hydrogenivirga sp. 128-5-R1-1 TaxID=392423 RepID=UPI0012F9A2E1|nr:hypothetical protein [Hydrogenivirga sp. 128-5-R1-1]
MSSLDICLSRNNFVSVVFNDYLFKLPFYAPENVEFILGIDLITDSPSSWLVLSPFSGRVKFIREYDEGFCPFPENLSTLVNIESIRPAVGMAYFRVFRESGVPLKRFVACYLINTQSREWFVTQLRTAEEIVGRWEVNPKERLRVFLEYAKLLRLWGVDPARPRWERGKDPLHSYMAERKSVGLEEIRAYRDELTFTDPSYEAYLEIISASRGVFDPLQKEELMRARARSLGVDYEEVMSAWDVRWYLERVACR